MANSKIWSTKTETDDENGPLWTFGIDGEGGGEGSGQKTPPRAQDWLKSASSQPASDPVLEKAAQRVANPPQNRWALKGGFGGPSPTLPEDYDFAALEQKYLDQMGGYDARAQAAGAQRGPEGYSDEDLVQAGIPHFDPDDVTSAYGALDRAGIDPGFVNPDFLAAEYGLSPEQALELWSALQDESNANAEQGTWQTPEEIAARGG